MRILMINHFPLEGSGSGTYTKNLATQLVKLGHEVCVILPLNTVDFPTYEGVRLHPVYFTNPDDPLATDAGALPFNFPCFTTHPVSVVAFKDLAEEQMAAYLHAFKVAIDEAVRCKETGEEKTILFGLTGTGFPDASSPPPVNSQKLSLKSAAREESSASRSVPG